MDHEMEAPIDNLEALFVVEDEELIGDAAAAITDSPQLC